MCVLLCVVCAELCSVCVCVCCVCVCCALCLIVSRVALIKQPILWNRTTMYKSLLFLYRNKRDLKGKSPLISYSYSTGHTSHIMKVVI